MSHYREIDHELILIGITLRYLLELLCIYMRMRQLPVKDKIRFIQVLAAILIVPFFMIVNKRR